MKCIKIFGNDNIKLSELSPFSWVELLNVRHFQSSSAIKGNINVVKIFDKIVPDNMNWTHKMHLQFSIQ